MRIIDCNNLQRSNRFYGGTAGDKNGVIFEDEKYILKYPGKLKNRNMKNIDLSYSNSPVSEFIGSHIYELIGIPVHETLLGVKGDKQVVLCKDFTTLGTTLYTFYDIKQSSSLCDGNTEKALIPSIEESLELLGSDPLLRDVSDAKERYWQMFIVDALIGNPDRNNTNWGFLIKHDSYIQLAPVYDNGNCFNPKWCDDKKLLIMQNLKSLIAESYTARRCILEMNGRPVNPYKVILSMQEQDCNKALIDLFPKINLEAIYNFLDEIPVEFLSEVSREYIKKLLYIRYNEVLKVTYEKLIAQDNVESPTWSC